MKFRRLLFVLLAVWNLSSLQAQGTRTLAGTEFWMTFTENIFTPADSVLHLIVSPYSKDTVTVFNPQVNHTESFPVEPGKQNIIYLKFNYLWYSKIPGSANTAVRIRSKRLVQIQAVNRIDGSTDISSIFPLSVIENARDYMVNHIAGDQGKEAQVSVVAIDTGTTTIELRITADLFTGQGKGSVYTRTLKQGQVYVMQALDTQSLAGSTIRVINSCKRIAVFAGSKCSRFPQTGSCFSCDALYEQLLPVSFSQTDYFITAPPDNTKYTVSVVANAANTNVYFNGVLIQNLTKGQQLLRQVTGSQLITADKPVNCLQVLHSSGCNGAMLSTSGDPSILQMAAMNQAVTEAYFPVLRSAKFKHFVNIIAEANSKPVFTINGTVINPSNIFQFTISSRTFWYCSEEVFTNNTYIIRSTTPFISYNYGMANAESYASVCGAKFERSDADFTANPDFQCSKNDPVQFQSSGDSLGIVSWFFGDGNSGLGFTTSHIYGQAGTFKVQMVNSRQGSCPDTVSRFVRVVNGPEIQLPMDTFPCEGTTLRWTLPVNAGYTYLWENGSTSFSRNFASSQTAILNTKDTNGCETKDTMKVTFKDCNNYELKLANVFTPGTDGKNDVWKVIYTGYQNIHVTIFNRWGEIVAAYTLPDGNDWNGKVNNQFTDCPDGVYFYRIEAVAIKASENKSVNGSIQLVRE